MKLQGLRCGFVFFIFILFSGVALAKVRSVSDLFSERVGGKNYEGAQFKMARINAAKQLALSKRPNFKFLDFGVGEPDGMPMSSVIEELCNASKMSSSHGYTYNGGKDFKEAVAEYMQKVFSIRLDSQAEIIHCVGSKTALSMLPLLFINPGDYIITTAPSYPILPLHVEYCGGAVYAIPIGKENSFLPDFESIPSPVLKKAKLLLLTYPNNPTGAVATKEFFERAIAWGKKHNIVIVNDAAYATLVFEGEPLSILQIPGAKDIAIELHSMSKAFNMAGWRIGWVCGNSTIIKLLGSVKNNTDSGQFLPIQLAAARALRSPEFTKTLVGKYERRAEILVSVLREIGFDVEKPKATMFLYTKSPRAAQGKNEIVHFKNAEEFSLWLINRCHISTVPWDDNGSYIRFSLGFKVKEADELAFVQELKDRLKDYTFIF